MKHEWFEVGALILCAGMFLVSNAMDPRQPARASWELDNWKGDTVHLEMERSTLTSRNVWGSDQPLADLHGLTAEQLRAGGANVKFTLDRDAGTFECEGKISGGQGRGDFKFIPNPNFITQLNQLGIGGAREEDLFHYAVRGLTLHFARQVKASGIPITEVSELTSLQDHGVNLDYIRDLAHYGFKDFTVADVTNLRDHGVDSAFLRSISEAGYKTLTAGDITNLRDHGVNNDFVKSLSDAGYKDIAAADMTTLRDHGVDPKYIARLNASGFRNLSIEQIVKLHDHGID